MPQPGGPPPQPEGPRPNEARSSGGRNLAGTHPDGRGLLISLDVSFDPYRRRLGSVLERYGPRLLHSVYDVTPPSGGVERLLGRIDEIVEPSDHVVAVPYCHRCRHHWRGTLLDVVPRHSWIVG